MARKRDLEATSADHTDTTVNAANPNKKRKHNHGDSAALKTKKKHKKHKEHKHKKDQERKREHKKEHKKKKKKEKKEKKKKSKSSEKDDTYNKAESSTATKDTTTSSSTKKSAPKIKVFNNRLRYSLTRDYEDEKVDKTPLYRKRIIADIPNVHHDFFISDSDSDSDDDIELNIGVEPALEWHKRCLGVKLLREKRLEWTTVENGLWSVQERIRLEKRVKRVSRSMGMDLAAFREDVLFEPPNEHLKVWWEIAKPFPKRDLNAVVEKVRSSYAANKYFGRWTKEEDEKLRELMRDGMRYASMVPYFPNRNAIAIQFRCYQLETQDQIAANIVKKGKWSDEEVKELYNAVKNYELEHAKRLDWKVIAAKLGGKRSVSQCRHKWSTVCGMLEKSQGNVRSEPLTIKDNLDLFERMQAKGWKKEEDIKFNELTTAKMTKDKARHTYLRNRMSIPGFQKLPYPEIISKLVETRRAMVESMEE